MTLREYIKTNPQSPIARAAKLSEEAHKGQKRKTGEPYIIHPLAVGDILMGWKLDETTIVAGLLHDTVEDTSINLERVKKEFGESAAFIVDGVSKLGKIKYRGAEDDQDQAENLRKMIVALSEDLRVVFVKLADRLHNMITLAALPPAKQKRIALETDEIYAPLAYRLGMQNVSGELQDLAFPYLYPREFEWLKEKVGDAYEARRKYATRISLPLKDALEKHGLKAEIQFRAKRWSSLYRKLLVHDMDLEKIYDLVALRLVVPNIEECYAALGIIHSLWVPVPGRIKDYIAMPKPNGYRSLHTTIIGPEKKMVEIQIRTKEMHEESENGIAAHWLYKQGAQSPNKTNELKWVSQLRAWQENYMSSDSEEFLESLKIEFFKHRIFAITPKGEVIDLPSGSTPVDFAYHIHTEIGNNCIGAKINGEIAPLNRELRSGDMVEILTQKNKRPSEDWLKFAKSSMAKNHIKINVRKKQTSLRNRK